VSPSFLKYHLCPDGVKVGDVLLAGKDAPITAGSVMKLKDIPLGVHIHNIELVCVCVCVRARARSVPI
jgi:large subunit ribosomal protein L2